MRQQNHRTALARFGIFAAVVMATVWSPATAAAQIECLVVSNSYADTVVTDFTANTTGINYTAFTTSTQVPTAADLAPYDVILMFEDGNYANAPAVGNAVAAFHETGKGVVIGTFYWQDSWGNFANYQALSPASGSQYAPDSIDPTTIVAHPVTVGVTALFADQYRGGTALEAGATALALWTTPNALGNPDPAVAVRTTAFGRTAAISVLPSYSAHGAFGTAYSGGFYTLFQNALTWVQGTTTSICGNGVPEGLEACDDGNANNNDDCLDTCVAATCGDGFLHNEGTGTEQCDDDNANNNDDCLDTCVSATCGDGAVHNQGTGTEQCDDGNANDNDDCPSSCEIAFCGDGTVHDEGAGNEECDDGNADDTDACLATCELASCGDGFVAAGTEDCDDGADNSDTVADACRTDCGAAGCGDGVIDSQETCDDGAANSDTVENACRTTCAAASCGDGVVDASEECDEGAANGGEDCADDCTLVPIAGCCSTGGGGPGPESLILMLGVILLATRRRR